MSQPQKRSKSEEQPITLDQVLDEYKNECKSRSAFSKDVFLKWLEEDSNRVYSLLLSGVIHGPRLDSFSLPYEFHPFDVTRDKNYKIASITDGSSTVSGKELVGISLLSNIAERNYDYGFFQLVKPSWMLGLKTVMTEKFKYAVPKEETEIEATRIFTFDAQTASYASHESILRILSHDYVQVEDFKIIATAVSLAAKTGLDIDKVDLSTPQLLATQLQRTDAAVAVQSLAQALYASHLKETNLVGRITAFIENPSPRLAALIDLKMPTKLKLVHTSNKSDVQAIPIGKLNPDDEIILSNVAISQEFYQKVTVASEVAVVKNTKGLAVKNAKQKVSPLKDPDTMTVRDFLKILRAIERDNQARGTPSTNAARVEEVDASAMAAFLQS